MRMRRVASVTYVIYEISRNMSTKRLPECTFCKIVKFFHVAHNNVNARQETRRVAYNVQF